MPRGGFGRSKKVLKFQRLGKMALLHIVPWLSLRRQSSILLLHPPLQMPSPGPGSHNHTWIFGHHFLGSVFTEPMLEVVSSTYVYASFNNNYCFHNDNKGLQFDDTHFMLPLVHEDTSPLDFVCLNY